MCAESVRQGEKKTRALFVGSVPCLPAYQPMTNLSFLAAMRAGRPSRGAYHPKCGARFSNSSLHASHIVPEIICPLIGQHTVLLASHDPGRKAYPPNRKLCLLPFYDACPGQVAIEVKRAPCMCGCDRRYVRASSCLAATFREFHSLLRSRCGQ
jgi:hypothetical protein